jgi:hypothetical protein
VSFGLIDIVIADIASQPVFEVFEVARRSAAFQEALPEREVRAGEEEAFGRGANLYAGAMPRGVHGLIPLP